MRKQIQLTKEQLYFQPSIEFGLPVVFMVINQQVGYRVVFYLPADKSNLKIKHQEYYNLINNSQTNPIGLPIDWVFDFILDPDSGFCKLTLTDTDGTQIPYIGFIRVRDLIDEIIFIMGIE